MITLIVLGILAIVATGTLMYGVGIYNELIKLQRETEETWSNIDVLLKQRRDELDKLLDTVQEHMDYESETMQKLTEARTAMDEAETPSEAAQAEQQTQGALSNLMAVAEDYPELKASDSFQKLQSRISEIEDDIADRREAYNAAVNTYNVRINQFPHYLIAKQIGYGERDLFEVKDAETEDVDISEQFD